MSERTEDGPRSDEEVREDRKLPDGIESLPQPLRAIAAGVEDALGVERRELAPGTIRRIAQSVERQIKPLRDVVTDATGQRIAGALEELAELQRALTAPRVFVPMIFGTGQKSPMPMTVTWPEGMTAEEASDQGLLRLAEAQA